VFPCYGRQVPDRLTPYPWDRLPRVSATQAGAATLVARWFGAVDTQQAIDTTRALLGCMVQIHGVSLCKRRPNPHAPTLEIAGDAHLLVELEGPLAAWIVDRALGGDATLKRLDAGPAPRNEAALGVLAYVAARVAQALPGHQAVSEVFGNGARLLRLDEDASVSCFLVRLAWDGVETPIHVWLLRTPTTQRTQPTPHPRLRDALAQERVVLSAQLTARAMRRVDPQRPWLIDDVIVLPTTGLSHDTRGYAGRVQLQVLGARDHVWIGHLQDDRIELQERHDMEHDGLTTGTLIASNAGSETLARVADAPLEVSVEIARFTLPLAAIASLAVGEVLLTGRPVGQHVTLRAGTRAIATGELVNVDGAIGVRILTLAGA
jgi:flagellar motor switch/type III secretory pathway protein FliN